MFRAGLVLCVLLGAETGAVLVGALGLGHGRGVALFVIGLNLAPWTGLLGFGLLYGSRRRRLEAARAGRVQPAVARIESVRAVGEGPEVPLQLDLSVAPEGRPEYRATARAVANVMALDEYRAGRRLLVEYLAVQPAHVRVRGRRGGGPARPGGGAARGGGGARGP
ncbi:hypothetical protein ACFV0G_21665, partial [Kitasatospora sp. NPDC059571]